MRYEIVFTKSALRELVNLPDQEVKRIVDKIDLLADDPRPHGSKKLKGLENEFWRIRVGQYRVVYSIEDIIRVVEIIGVGHRKDIY